MSVIKTERNSRSKKIYSIQIDLPHIGGGGHGAEPGETFRVALGSRNGLFKGFMMRAEEEEDDRPRSSRGGREKRAPRGENEIQLPRRVYSLIVCVFSSSLGPYPLRTAWPILLLKAFLSVHTVPA